jgi:peptidoglycan hydrolase-like protein with peptidoglycan-binding domain
VVRAEPPPAPVEVEKPPASPPPPVDTSPALPTPPAKEWGATVDVPVGDKYREAAEQGMKAPASPAPSAPKSSGPPAGFDGTVASTLAPGVAANIKAKQYDFDRAALKRFQTAAGVAADGVYGDDTWGALLYFTSAAPRALYKPNLPTPYPWGKFVSAAPTSAAEPPPAAVERTPPPASPHAPADVQSAQVGPVPPAGFNPTSAKKLAKQVAANIDSKGKAGYSRTLLKQFQTAAGIASDGLYGGEARRALIYYGVPRPPTAAFAPVAMPPDYVWALQAQASS